VHVLDAAVSIGGEGERGKRRCAGEQDKEWKTTGVTYGATIEEVIWPTEDPEKWCPL